jgi:succinate dehydrogenase flavin-adding protein (antitoxin of CptAB toxin-antitoxin module)
MKPKSNKEIQKYFNQIDSLFDKFAKQNSEALEQAKIKPIHELFPYAQNGICAYIATMGSGKSYQFTKLMAKQQGIFEDPFYELVVYCSTSEGFDETVETFKKAITKSKLVSVKDSNLLEWLNKYMRRTLKYNAINKLLRSDFEEITDEMERIITKHRFKLPNAEPKISRKEKFKFLEYLAKKIANYNWKTYPHRLLLILDDFASHPLVRSKETEMSRLLKKLRHFNINVIICVQTSKSIPREIKRILHDCVLFPGMSKDDFDDLMKEGPFGNFDRKQLWNIYSGLKNPHDQFLIHIAARRAIINYA